MNVVKLVVFEVRHRSSLVKGICGSVTNFYGSFHLVGYVFGTCAANFRWLLSLEANQLTTKDSCKPHGHRLGCSRQGSQVKILNYRAAMNTLLSVAIEDMPSVLVQSHYNG